MGASRIRILVALLAVFAIVGAACSDNSSTVTPATGGGSTSGGGDTVCATADMSAGDMLAKICESGTLRVATDPQYPPAVLARRGDRQVGGLRHRHRRGARLLDWASRSSGRHPRWDVITAGRWNDRWDISVGSMTITPERRPGPGLHASLLLHAGQLAVNADNTSITSPADLTGKKVGVGGATTYESYLEGTLEIPDYPIDFQMQDADIVTYKTPARHRGPRPRRLCAAGAAFSAVPTCRARSTRQADQAHGRPDLLRAAGRGGRQERAADQTTSRLDDGSSPRCTRTARSRLSRSGTRSTTRSSREPRKEAPRMAAQQVEPGDRGDRPPIPSDRRRSASVPREAGSSGSGSSSPRRPLRPVGFDMRVDARRISGSSSRASGSRSSSPSGRSPGDDPGGLLARSAACRRTPIAYGVSGFYTSFFRGTPLIVQMFLIYLALPQIGLNLAIATRAGGSSTSSLLSAVFGRHPRPRAELRGVHDRDLPGRHPVGGPRARLRRPRRWG